MLLLVLVSGCSHPDYRAAIQQVLDARVQTRTQTTRHPKDRTEVMGLASMNPNAVIFDAQDYALILSTINPAKCPGDFRHAWSVYVSAWHYRAFANDNPSFVLQSGMEISQSESVGAFDEGSGANGDGESHTVSAWKDVEDVSAKYGANADP